jgi:UDP-2,3-diacylglucosamine hydrolase
VPGTLFISDLHLSGERPATNQRFFGFLREQASRAAALYVLGDLFEYWIGDDALESPGADPLAREVAAGFAALARAGVPVHLMHGNRDFLLGEAFCAASGARMLEDPTIVTLEGERVLLMHGDTLCTDDVDYQGWRRTARSEAWQRSFLAQTREERYAAIHGLREKSKAVIQAKPAEIMDVNAGAVREALRAHGVARLIHGHTHRAAGHVLDIEGRRCERWVLPDWYGPGGYLALERGEARLVFFEGASRAA